MSFYEEIEIEDMDYVEEELMYYYPCPCGDKFRISLEELYDGEDVGHCPSCTLRIKIIFEEDDLPELPEFEDDDEEQGAVDGAATDTTPSPSSSSAAPEVEVESMGSSGPKKHEVIEDVPDAADDVFAFKAVSASVADCAS